MSSLWRRVLTPDAKLIDRDRDRDRDRMSEHLLPLSSGRGGPRLRVALVVSLLGFN